MSGWIAHQLQALRLVISRFKENWLSTLLISLAIGVSMALPVIMYVMLDSFGGLVNDVKKNAHISVFMKLDHADTTINNIKETLKNHDAIKSFEFVSKDEALEQLKIANGNDNLIDSLHQNPLPNAFFIEPRQLDASSVETLKNQLAHLDGVAEVQIDDAWLKRLNYLLALGEKAMLIVALLLGLAIFAVVGNTIRMQILTQQEEIEVSQLIGATNSFIRRPFLYAGALYGLFGGITTLIITSIVIILFNKTLTQLAAEYQTNFNLNLPNADICMTTCLISIAIGFISAYIAVSKSLSKSNN
jgi:cell division transport system permease protein